MLPSNPSVTRRLPSTPRVQSRSASRSHVGDDSHQSRVPLRHGSLEAWPSHHSTDSDGSTSSLLKDHLRSSAVSSDTSLEDQAELCSLNSTQDHTPEVESGEGTVDYASWFGGYVASAAKTLTINATKAWSAHITTDAGEETPPGHDSRLTRAMKAYHLEKARDLTDLPTWLFGESESRAHSGKSTEASQRSRREQPPQSAATYSQRSLALPSRRPPASYTDDRGTSKATERLKAMRDAKRKTSRNVGPRQSDSNAAPMAENTQGEDRDDKGPKQRVGLPSGPRRKIGNGL